MTPPHTGLTAQLRALLADGAWHPFVRLEAATAELVRPETAVRAYRGAWATTRLPLEHQVRLGRRRCIYRALQALATERRGPAKRPGAQEYRLPRPESQS